MVEPERFMGNLWIVRGGILENFVPSGRPVIVVPGYTNYAVHPQAAALSERFPALAKILQRGRWRMKELIPCLSGRYSRISGEGVSFVVVPVAYHSPYGDTYYDGCGMSQFLDRATKWNDGTEFHWQEFLTGVDVHAQLCRLFWASLNRRRGKRFVYYNPDWAVEKTREIVL